MDGGFLGSKLKKWVREESRGVYFGWEGKGKVEGEVWDKIMKSSGVNVEGREEGERRARW